MMKNKDFKHTKQLFKNSGLYIIKIAAFAFFLVFFIQESYSQSFVLDLQYNAMSFTNAEKTVLNDPDNNGGLGEGSVHRYDNVITVDGVVVYAKMTLLEVDNANIVIFDDDNLEGSPDRFQPRIGAGSGGGYVLYQMEFFDTSDDEPIFLENYYVTGVDVDGSGSSNREYAEYGGYESYQIDATTLLTVSTNPGSGRTRFTGRSNSLGGITFDNTAAYIVNYSNPNNVITFAIGQTGQNNVRYNSVQFGAPGGIFTTPETTYNPLVIAVDDNGTTVDGTTGGTSVSNILDNDLYDGNPVTTGDVSVSVVSAASDPGVELNTTTGEVTVDAGTPIGTYTIVYQICLNADPNNCDIANIFVEVSGSTSVTNYFPAGGYGTLAFEDLWPGKGDYDFNDLVLDYQFEITSDASNYVDEVVGTFVIKAFGATLENGFGFQLSDDINPADLSVSGYSLSENYITLEANGTESGQSKPTIIVYDNAFNEMTHPGVGIGVNTEPGAPYIDPVSLTITITFPDDTYTLTDLNIAGFNPFLIVDLNRGVEVHLPDYKPTDLVDQSIFGTLDDDSDPASDRYYKTENNLPWAINIYESFDYPKEKVEIVNAHLRFADWATSNGNLYPDWYQDNPGYRNENNIYVIP